MVEKDLMVKIQSELDKGMSPAKCRKCGCMKETLMNLQSSLSAHQAEGFSNALENIEQWLKQIEPSEYTCLGCEYCYPVVVTNILNQAFPETLEVQSPGCSFEVKKHMWPPWTWRIFYLL